MITAYLWTTPNGYKIAVALEEFELDYEISWINIGKKEQFQPEFLAISPNGRIPAIADHETGVKMMESGAILQYLAEKTGRYGGSTLQERAKINQWLHWQMGGLGPMMGQANHFRALEIKVPYAEKRYLDESLRLFQVLDRQLDGRDYIVGRYSIADMATAPWAAMHTYLEDDRFKESENVLRWIATNLERPATAKAIGLSPERSA